MMAPGFTSKGGFLPDTDSALPAGAVVAIETEGKEHAAALGILKMATEDIKSVNKGVAVEVMCYLGDDLWNVEKI
jgi:malignant T-cell-amplified sequence